MIVLYNRANTKNVPILVLLMELRSTVTPTLTVSMSQRLMTIDVNANLDSMALEMFALVCF
jgi:hypothetical protein